MKKIILLFIVFITIDTFSQNYLQNRITIDYSLSANIHDGDLGLSVYGIKNKINKWLDNDINITFRTGRKTSIELLTGIKKYKYESYSVNFNEITCGLGINLYYGRNYSPIGNSIGIFYKVSNHLVEDYNKFYAFLQSIGEDTYETNTVINYQVSVIGFKMNFISMLSNKIPLFLKYGGSLSLPVSNVIFDASYSKGSFSEYRKGLNDRGLMDNFTRSEVYKLNFGLGYMF